MNFIICEGCRNTLSSVAEITKCETVHDDFLGECETCGVELIYEYFTVTSLELSDEIIQKINESIFACESDNCGRKWDAEDQTYIADETNSTAGDLLSDVVSELPDSPYQNLLEKLSWNGELGEINCTGIECQSCGGSIDSWLVEVKVRIRSSLLPRMPGLPEEIKTIQSSSPSSLIEYFRSDCSPYLIHLTRGRELAVAYDNVDYDEEYDHVGAPQILYMIIKTAELKACRGSGMRHEAICFTEKPITALKEALIGKEAEIRARKSALVWAPYGLMFSKNYLIENHSVEPVIAVKKDGIESIPEPLRYRCVSYSEKTSFLHEREWRCNKNIQFDTRECIVLLPNFEQVNIFQKVFAEEKIEVKGFLPLYDLFAST